MRESPVLRWASRISGVQVAAMAALLASTCAVLAALAANQWRNPIGAVQTVHLMALVVAFAVLMWGFWGAVASGAWACVTVLAVTVVIGHFSLREHAAVSRFSFWMESILFVLSSYLCLRFAEREELEETVGKRQLEKLETEYLDQAVRYGKSEELLKVLEEKGGRMKKLEEMAAGLRSRRENVPDAIRTQLDFLCECVGKGEAEVSLYEGGKIVRHPRGADPYESTEGPDEIDRWITDHRTALLVNNLPNDVRFTRDFGKRRQVVSLVAVPFVSEEVLLGVLRMTSIVPQAFSHEDLRFISDAAALLLPALVKNR